MFVALTIVSGITGISGFTKATLLGERKRKREGRKGGEERGRKGMEGEREGRREGGSSFNLHEITQENKV